MKNVLITIQLASNDEFDMEFSPDVPLVDVVSQLVKSQEWDIRNTTYELQFDGKTIHLSKTLAELDLWNGTKLVLHPRYSSLNPVSSGTSQNSTISSSYLADN